MNDITFGSILSALTTGLPVLLGHFSVCVVLLAAGITLYTRLTPFDELGLIRKGSVAGGISISGAIVAMAIPLAATLATTTLLVDIVMWGVVALILQLVTYWVATRLVRDLCSLIAEGNAAAATVLAGIQIGVALLNAAAMAG